MAQVKYLSIGSQPVQTVNPVVTGSFTGDYNQNPIFNFDQTFIDKLNSVSPVVLGQSQPYINLKILDPSGNTIGDLNLDFFHKSFDTSQISSDIRYSERPVMSLREVQLKTDLASGYLYYTNVTIQIKVHRPDSLGASFLMALLFPGMPFQLEYGWNSTDHEFLDPKDVLVFSVKTYNLSMDASGQIDLTIEGMAFNERFNNTLIGDLSTLPAGAGNVRTTKDEIDGLKSYQDKLQSYTTYLQDLMQRTNSNINDYSLLQKFAETYKTIESKTRTTGISKNYSDKFKALGQAPLISQLSFGAKNRTVSIVKFHDIIFNMCNDTFNAFGNVMNGVRELRIIYGSFNEKAGPYANKSIADFPVFYKSFRSKLQALVENGKSVPTIEAFINVLLQDVMENEELWKQSLSKVQGSNANPTPDIFNKPDVISHFITRRTSDGNLVMELYLIDINNGLPITTVELGSARQSQDAAESAIRARVSNFPILRVGHANSFIKNITMNQISDQYMKATLIERMSRNRVSSQRDTLSPKDSLDSSPVTPLTLPLQGKASVLGHVQWKPFRAFFLSSGLFLVDGVYKITSVTHTLGADGFNTDIEFLWH